MLLGLGCFGITKIASSCDSAVAAVCRSGSKGNVLSLEGLPKRLSGVPHKCQNFFVLSMHGEQMPACPPLSPPPSAPVSPPPPLVPCLPPLLPRPPFPPSPPSCLLSPPPPH